MKELSEFFQKVPINLIKMYLTGSFQSTHKELSILSCFITTSQRTCQVYGWVHFDQIDGYFLKELGEFFQKYLLVNLVGSFETNSGVLFKKHPLGTLVGTF